MNRQAQNFEAGGFRCEAPPECGAPSAHYPQVGKKSDHTSSWGKVSDQESREAPLDCGNSLPLWRKGQLLYNRPSWKKRWRGTAIGAFSTFDLAHPRPESTIPQSCGDPRQSTGGLRPLFLTGRFLVVLRPRLRAGPRTFPMNPFLPFWKPKKLVGNEQASPRRFGTAGVGGFSFLRSSMRWPKCGGEVRNG